MTTHLPHIHEKKVSYAMMVSNDKKLHQSPRSETATEFTSLKSIKPAEPSNQSQGLIDIKAFKKSEAKLVQSKETLERRVDERTRELREANLKISQELDLFFKLFHSNPSPTSLTQFLDGKFIDVNSAYLEFVGLSREDVIGHTSLELGLPFAKEIRPQILERLREENLLSNLELKVKRPTGEIAIVIASLQLIKIDQTEALLMSFIDISERVRAEQQTRALAYELTKAEQAERDRISRLLHDDLQQGIFAAKIQAANLHEAYRRGDPEAAQSEFDRLQSLLSESITLTRNLSIDLSPAILKGEGLSDALAWLAGQMKEQYGLKVSMHTNGIPTHFDDTLRIILFQAVREALFNIVKHAKTLHATISMEKNNEQIKIIVSDDGVGLLPESADFKNGVGGLANIRPRIQLLGCELHAESESDRGTRVIIQIPAGLVTT